MGTEDSPTSPTRPADNSLKPAASPTRRVSNAGNHAARKNSFITQAVAPQVFTPIASQGLSSRTPEAVSPAPPRSPAPKTTGRTKTASLVSDAESSGHVKQVSPNPSVVSTGPPKQASTSPSVEKVKVPKVTPPSLIVTEETLNVSGNSQHGRGYSTGMSPGGPKSATPKSALSSQTSTPKANRRTSSKPMTQEEIFNENMLNPSVETGSKSRRPSTRPTKRNRKSMMPDGSVISEGDSNPNLLDIESTSAPATNRRASRTPSRAEPGSAPATNRRSRSPTASDKRSSKLPPPAGPPTIAISSQSNDELDDFSNDFKSKFKAEKENPLDQFRINEPEENSIPVFMIEESSPISPGGSNISDED
jgi:hypothetical protein